MQTMAAPEQTKHPVEAQDSWEIHLSRSNGSNDDDDAAPVSRLLKHHHSSKDKQQAKALLQLEQDKESAYLNEEDRLKKQAQAKKAKKRKKHSKKLQNLFDHPGIKEKTVHGLMIDAGSSGSRMHLYEWEPRILGDEHEVQEAVSGRKLSYPGTESRWTDRLRPGIATFASVQDDKILLDELAEYLAPLMDFASNVLKTKQADFGNFPIYLRATAGMRTLTRQDRARVMTCVRDLFKNITYSPFLFVDEQARVLSGEEEAVYGWAAVNSLYSTLIEDSQGAGSVVNPRLTYGALDLGGASTQISFYESNEDIMSNLFKLQIGGAKHWNIYAHSFLYYGVDEAVARYEASLIDGKNATQRLMDGVYDPCLNGGVKKQVRNNIHFSPSQVETWDFADIYGSGNGYQHSLLINPNKGGDYDECAKLVTKLLHKDKNDWCNFAHRGDCSFAGIYQPNLPKQSKHFGEFLAFSNYFHVWDFLQLPSRSSLRDLQNATKVACALNDEELQKFNHDGRIEAEFLHNMCFRSTYAFELLYHGYGFDLDQYVTASDVVAGQKIGWTLGSMMYEINAMPWSYESAAGSKTSLDAVADTLNHRPTTVFFSVLVFGMVGAMLYIFRSRRQARQEQYEPIKGGAV